MAWQVHRLMQDTQYVDDVAMLLRNLKHDEMTACAAVAGYVKRQDAGGDVISGLNAAKRWTCHQLLYGRR